MKIKCVLKGANFPDFRLDYFFFSLIGVQLPIFAFFFANYSGRRWERERERELSAPARRWWCTLEIRNFRLVRQRGSLCAHIHVTFTSHSRGMTCRSTWRERLKQCVSDSQWQLACQNNTWPCWQFAWAVFEKERYEYTPPSTSNWPVLSRQARSSTAHM